MGVAATYKSLRGIVAVCANYTADELCAMAYRYHRRKGVAATQALSLARTDAANGKSRYASSLAGGWNRAYDAHGESHMRWVENPAECGLRFVGYADELARIEHRGWFLDWDFQDETARGIVYQLPARRGRPLFVSGYADPFNGKKGHESTNPACLSFSSVTIGESGYFSTSPGDNPDAADAARLADGIAESMAERERDYRQASNARQRFEQCADDIKDLWSQWSAILHECRAMRRAMANAADCAPTLARTIGDRLADIRDDIAKLKETRETLESDFSHADGWQDY